MNSEVSVDLDTCESYDSSIKTKHKHIGMKMVRRVVSLSVELNSVSSLSSIHSPLCVLLLCPNLTIGPFIFLTFTYPILN